MISETFDVESELWIFTASKGAWHFVTIPSDTTAVINQLFQHVKHGWGSLPVKATIGKTSWKTSIFPDTKTQTFILPVKAEVRQIEKIAAGDKVAFKIEITD
jgi:hypothetical protein